MLYWFTGQPGHGKTLHSLEFVIEMKADADKKHADKPDKYPKRELFICNVRDMQFSKVGAVELSADEFKGWADSPEYLRRLAEIHAEADKLIVKKQRDEFLADRLEELEKSKCATEQIDPRYINAIILIDEAYEHGIFPKRAPGAPLPRHVERVAKHRHYGIDLVCVSQSPDKQCDQFLHDLIERHVHVRRRFGTQYVHLREFDKFTANAEKAIPLVNRRKMLPKKMFGLYKSTELDTTERRIPWYYIAFFIGVPLGAWMFYNVFGNMGTRLTGQPAPVPAAAATGAAQQPEANGAPATVADGAAPAGPPSAKLLTESEIEQLQAIYAQQFRPVVASMPWTAPAYGSKLSLSQEAPRIFCSIASPGEVVDGTWRENSKCSCITEQGTTYLLDMMTCQQVATKGQYEPFRDEPISDQAVDGYAQQDRHRQELRVAHEARSMGEPGEVARYGEFREEPKGPDKYQVSGW